MKATRKTFLFQAHPKLPVVSVTPKMVAILTVMERSESAVYDTGESELVYEKGAGWWNGFHRVPSVVANRLLQAVALRADSNNEMGQFERYTINETGRDILRQAAEQEVTE